MNIVVDVDHEPKPIDEDRVARICAMALSNMGAPDDSEVSVTFVSNDEMAELNEQYRGKLGPTDVLSFECDNIADDFPTGEYEDRYMLGDIVIAAEVADRQCKEFGNSFEDELDLLCVHAILHLLGYDHIEDDEAAEMEGFQKDILEKWRKREERNA